LVSLDYISSLAEDIFHYSPVLIAIQGDPFMKSVVVYDTRFGNTEEVAKGIAKALMADIIKASEVTISELKSYDTLVFGSPTHGGNMSDGMKDLFSRMKGESFKGKKAAAFDTKYNRSFTGSAAKKMEGKLKKLGFDIAVKPMNFFVRDQEGPLEDGELQNCEKFGKDILSKIENVGK
jgi:flavodoxin I